MDDLCDRIGETEEECLSMKEFVQKGRNVMKGAKSVLNDVNKAVRNSEIAKDLVSERVLDLMRQNKAIRSFIVEDAYLSSKENSN